MTSRSRRSAATHRSRSPEMSFTDEEKINPADNSYTPWTGR
jgi:hypothetical protein